MIEFDIVVCTSPYTFTWMDFVNGIKAKKENIVANVKEK